MTRPADGERVVGVEDAAAAGSGEGFVDVDGGRAGADGSGLAGGVEAELLRDEECAGLPFRAGGAGGLVGSAAAPVGLEAGAACEAGGAAEGGSFHGIGKSGASDRT